MSVSRKDEPNNRSDEGKRTMWPGDLAPDDSNLGPSNQLLRSIDKGNLLAEIEAILEPVESVDVREMERG